MSVNQTINNFEIFGQLTQWLLFELEGPQTANKAGMDDEIYLQGDNSDDKKSQEVRDAVNFAGILSKIILDLPVDESSTIDFIDASFEALSGLGLYFFDEFNFDF